MRRQRSLTDRFWEKVDRYSDPDGCWLWKGALNTGGYGMIGHYRKPMITAHRLSWELENGDIPNGLLILHMCDVKNCVNPRHLRLGTQAENIRDAVTKGRFRPRGKPCKAFTVALMLNVKPGSKEYGRLYYRLRKPELEKERRLKASLKISIEETSK